MSASNSAIKVPCPLCPGSSKLFVNPKGLNIHINRIHGNKNQPSQPALSLDASASIAGQSLPDLAGLKRSITVLKHIPKGARYAAAGKLKSIIDCCLHTNDTKDWFALLSFAFPALRVPEGTARKSLTEKVKENIENPSVHRQFGNSQRPFSIYRSIESKVHDGDLKGAVRLLLSDSTLAPDDDSAVRALEEKHPVPSRQLTYPLNRTSPAQMLPPR